MKKTYLLSGCAVLLVVMTITSVWKISAFGQTEIRPSNKDDGSNKDLLLQRIERSPALPVSVIESSDSPVRITEASVKVISGDEFTKLTGKVNELTTVSSLPTFSIVNNSDRIVSGFMLMFRDPVRTTSRIISFNNLRILPGETYSVERDDMVSGEVGVFADSSGPRKMIGAKAESPNYWIANGNFSDSFVTIGKVTFADGGSWIIAEGGGIR